MDKSLFVTIPILIAFAIFLREGYYTVEYCIQTYHENQQFFNQSSFLRVQRKQQNEKSPLPTLEKSQILKINSTKKVMAYNKTTVYHNTTTKKPKLNAYERMLLMKKEKRRNFTAAFMKQQNEELDPTNNETKYVVFKPIEAGFGNSMAVLVESLLFAYFTNRHFYLNDYQIFKFYFDLPFNDYLLESAKFTNENSVYIKNTCKFLETDLLNSTKKYIVFGSSCKMIDYFVYSDDYIPIFRENGFILNEKGNINADLRKIVFNFLYTEIVKVKPFVMNEVEKVKQELKWNDYYVIALQIRSGKIARDDTPNFFINREDTNFFVLKAKEITAEVEATQPKPVRWFIASDSKNVKKEILVTNKDRVISADCAIKHSIVDMHKREETDGMLCTLVDAYLIASSEVVIMTARSTYGIWAANQNMNIRRIPVRKGEYITYIRSKRKM